MAQGSKGEEFPWLQFLPCVVRKWLSGPKRCFSSRPLYLFLAVTCVGLLALFVNLNFSSAVSETMAVTPQEESVFPYIVAGVVSKQEVTLAEKERRRRADIFARILQKRLRKQQRGQNQTWCIHPKLDLKHDTNRFAFYDMPPLNCTGNGLFYPQKGVLKLNSSVVSSPSLLGTCLYYSIQRTDDNSYSYTLLETRESPPFDISIADDFVRVTCVLKSTLAENKERARLDSSDIDSVRKENYDIYELDGRKRHSNSSASAAQKVKRNLTEKFGSEDDTNTAANEASRTEQNEYSEEENSDEYYAEWESDFIGDHSNLPEWGYSDYDQLLAQIHPQPQVFQRIARVKADMTGQQPMKLNVLMFALDSMSHLSYQRKLPRTYKFLKEELGAAILQNYNIVGDATTAAIIPMLTGQTEMSLPEVRRTHWDGKMVNEYPLIWNNFSQHGYVTLFAEDEPSLSIFNLRLKGFSAAPTDHYMRPFWLALWDSRPRYNSEQFCTGDTANHRLMLNYLEDFFVQYDNVSRFAFGFHGELSHNDNNPAEYIDGDLVEFLRRLKQRHILEDTVVIIYGDHGARYNKVRHTMQGKLEERLPFMSFVFPPKFRRKYPHLYRNLITNTQRLSTPFDVHQTLLHILDLSGTGKSISTPPGVSLLREIPKERTCADAGVGVHWCACLHQVRVEPGEEFVRPAARALVGHLNTLTDPHRPSCVRLQLTRVLSVFLLIPDQQVLKYQQSKDADQREANFSHDVDLDVAYYQLLVETQPCGALFEATVMADFRNYSNYKFTVTPGISRINKYGVQSKCIEQQYPWLRKFCCCLERVTERAAEEASRHQQNTPLGK